MTDLSKPKTVDTIVEDIYGILGSGKVSPSPEAIKHLSDSIAQHVAQALAKREPKPVLRGSGMGTLCNRKTWYEVNAADEAIEPKPHELLKFLFGHIHEDLTLFLAEQAGHKVTKRQKTVDVYGVEGHIDAVIDGVLVDVKSANSRGMNKFRGNGLLKEDPFGYLKQIDFYREGMKNDTDVTDRNRVAFLAADKELGHLVLDVYERTDEHANELVTTVAIKQEVVKSTEPPARHYGCRPDGTSGNMALGLECSYCPYKKKCWPGLRTFLYSNGPRFLTKVVREPDVLEITNKNG